MSSPERNCRKILERIIVSLVMGEQIWRTKTAFAELAVATFAGWIECMKFAAANSANWITCTLSDMNTY